MNRRELFRRLQGKTYRQRTASRRPRNRQKSHRPKFILFGVLLLIGGALFGTWNLLSSGKFDIQNIGVYGTESIPPEDIQFITESFLNERRFLLLNNKKQFLFNPTMLQETLSNTYAFESLDISLENQTLLIHVKEKLSQLIWVSGEEEYLVDLEGRIIRPLFEEELQQLKEVGPVEEESEEKPEKNQLLKQLPKFIDINNAPIQTGQLVLSPEEVEGTFRFTNHLSAQGIETMNQIRIDRLAGRWMSLQTELGFDILFDPAQDTDLQAANLETLLRDTINEPSSLTYIDLRFGDHVYFK